MRNYGFISSIKTKGLKNCNRKKTKKYISYVRQMRAKEY